eukprot:2861634-Amphidinium_carterae.1
MGGCHCHGGKCTRCHWTEREQVHGVKGAQCRWSESNLLDDLHNIPCFVWVLATLYCGSDMFPRWTWKRIWLRDYVQRRVGYLSQRVHVVQVGRTLSFVTACSLTRKSVSLCACLHFHCECLIATWDLGATAVRLVPNWIGMDDLPDFDGEGEETSPKPGGVLSVSEDEVMPQVHEVKSEGATEVMDGQAVSAAKME